MKARPDFLDGLPHERIESRDGGYEVWAVGVVPANGTKVRRYLIERVYPEKVTR